MSKKALLGLGFMLMVFGNVYCQHYPDFELLSYMERYDSLATDTTRTYNDFYKKFKYSPISKKPGYYVSFGADYRFQYYRDINEQWGDMPEDKDGYTKSRLLVHSSWHFGKYIRAFSQIQSSLVNGRANPIPLDENPLEIHQGFIDVNALQKQNLNIKFRVGRQEMVFGSQRLVTVREGVNNRLAFDGVHSILKFKNSIETNLFFTTEVKPKLGIFDDQFLNTETRFWGNYWSYTQHPSVMNVDVYYFGLDRANSVFNSIEGRERRHTVGARFWKSKGKWRFDNEFTYQFGSLASQSISAYAAAINTTYSFGFKSQPILGFRTDLVSGDQRKTDNQLNSFNPLFPRGGYYGFIPMVGPVNIIDLHPSFSINLLSKLNYYIEYNVFYRTSVNDGVYTPSGKLMYSDHNSPETYIGSMLYSNLVYQLNRNMVFTFEASWFKPGSYIKQVSAGKNGFTFDVQMQITL